MSPAVVWDSALLGYDLGGDHPFNPVRLVTARSPNPRIRAFGTRVDRMSPAVVWDSALLGYDLGGDHPFNPVRLELTVRLATELGVLDDVPLLVPGAAGDEELLRIHAPEY